MAARSAVTRRHRTRRLAALLLSAVAVAVLVGWMIYRATPPDVRRPGESLPEITERLSKGLPANAPELRFTDVTEESGLGDFVTFAGPRTSQLPEDMGAGLAWGDFDDDGDDDLFLVAAGGALGRPESWATSQLYENLVIDAGSDREGEAKEAEPGFRRVEDFPELRLMGMAAAWGDADGDRDLDLVVSGYRSLLLVRNDNGRFAVDPTFPGDGEGVEDGYWAGVSWADFDADGDLDLYVCGYVQYVEAAGEQHDVAQTGVTQQYGAAVPYTLNPASFDPGRNLLLQNVGDGTFEDVALLWGVANPEGRSLSALWHDFDADGRPDLYVANDISDNALFLNRGDSFEDAGLEAWVADYRGAMGLAAGDWNGDGDDDLFVAHWIAQENALYDSRLADLPDAERLTFTDVAARVGLGQIALHMVGWGTEFADLDADGRLDLLVANGSTLEAQDGSGLEPQPLMLLWNQGEHFHDLASLPSAAPSFSEPRVHRGLAVSDHDLDGDLDVAVTSLDGGVKLLRNDTGSGHWLKVRLRGRPGRPSQGEGATLVAHVVDRQLRRSVTGASYLSQSSRAVHFGLGDAASVDRLDIHWPSGEVQTFDDLAAGATFLLVEGEAAARRIGEGDESAQAAMDDPQRVREFWKAQRAAMDAMKRDGEPRRAVELFRRALELDPGHGDSRYYLANCLWALGHGDEALAHLDRLRRDRPSSHRAHKHWGVLRALSAESDEHLAEARRALERAVDINAEEVGALLVLGQLDLMAGDTASADQRLEWVGRTHPKAVGAFYLRAYLAWRRGDDVAARRLLEQAREARGEDWKPEGTVAEGDVVRRMHREETPLSIYWQRWDGTPDPSAAFADLAARLGS